jgi:hypothetical protein
MTYTFSLYVIDQENDKIYAEYHNFRELADEFLYYRGGATHPLEIAISKQSAIDSMDKLFKAGWTCDSPKIIQL